jgi:membrane protease subunit (stomatin/prohibitin family)
MKAAASNEGGAMNGFIGMGMAMNAGGGMNAQNFYNMPQQNQQNQQQQPQQNQQPQQSSADAWKCPKCGNMAKGKFCTECGSPKPANSNGWICKCGAVNKGKFCQECGSPKPAGEPLYKCDKMRLGTLRPEASS